jgi:hypothetical protein
VFIGLFAFQLPDAPGSPREFYCMYINAFKVLPGIRVDVGHNHSLLKDFNAFTLL